jgi:hypothetical protein
LAREYRIVVVNVDGDGDGDDLSSSRMALPLGTCPDRGVDRVFDPRAPVEPTGQRLRPMGTTLSRQTVDRVPYRPASAVAVAVAVKVHVDGG